jgi:hypothetical protein
VVTRASGIFALLVASCSAQETPLYRGEPLAVIHGAVISAPHASPIPAAEAVLLWSKFSGADDNEWMRVAVQSGFPSTYRIPLYTPPPASVLVHLGQGPTEPGLAIAGVSVFAAGAATGDTSSFLGVARAAVVVYLAADAPNGTETAKLFGAPLHAGYHVLRVVADPLTTAQRDACEKPLRDQYGCSDAQAARVCADRQGDTHFALDPGDLDTPVDVSLLNWSPFKSTPRPCEPVFSDEPSASAQEIESLRP